MLKAVIFYWLKEKEDIAELKTVLEGLHRVKEVKNLAVREPCKEIADDLLDASYDLAMELSVDTPEDFQKVFVSPEHRDAEMVFHRIVEQVQGYSMEC